MPEKNPISENKNGSETTAAIESLVNRLDSRQFAERREAMEELARIGPPAVPALISRLSKAGSHFRWRVAKVLVEIADPRAAPALVAGLEDQDAGTRWVTAEALIALGQSSLPPLFEALISRSDSYELLEGAHHVLHELARGELQSLVEPVLFSLEGPAPEDTAPVAAARALEIMKSPPA